jgi:hypothetical protein
LSSYRRIYLVLGLVIGLALLRGIYSLPIAENFYAEILEYSNGNWTSRYLLVNDYTLSFNTVANVIVVRTDPSSGLQPITVFIDGVPYRPSIKTGTLWFSYIVQLDGKPHTITVSFQRRTPLTSMNGIIGLKSASPLSAGTNLTIPIVPGFVPAGYRVELLLSSSNDLATLFNKPFFVLNASIIDILSQRLVAVDILVPFTNVTIGQNFISGTLWYLYFLPSKEGIVTFPPYDFRAIYVNYPGYKSKGENFILANPPHVALYFPSGLSASESLGRYSVNVAVALPDTLCNIKDYTFKIIPPQDGYVNENTVFLGENTTLTVRFFSGGISIGDLIIYSPPPSLLVQPPIYSLEIRFLDLMGYPVNNTSFIIYSRGIPVYRGFTPSGKAVVCPLPKGSYDIVAYLGSLAIGKGKVDVFSDQSMDVRTNTSTVRFQFVRQGTGEILKDYTAILRGYVTMRANSSMDGIVVYHGVPPGNYKLDVLWNGTLLATYDVSIDLSSADKVLSIQAYKLQVLVRNLLDQPVKNIQVLLEGRDFSKSRLTDEMGRVDFGFVPAGNYTLIVEQALPQKLEVSQDTFKVVQIDEVAKIYGFTITGKILSLAVGLIFVLTMIWLIAKIVKRFIHRGKGIEEV